MLLYPSEKVIWRYQQLNVKTDTPFMQFYADNFSSVVLAADELWTSSTTFIFKTTREAF